MNFKLIGLLLLLLPLTPFAGRLPRGGMSWDAAPTQMTGKADLIRVDKSERRLDLLRGNVVLARYHIALGTSPVGGKVKEGDRRTPEGRYVIDWRNAKSGYHLSMHISYPNADDIAKAKAIGASAGSNIMIHGQPNGYAVPASLLLQQIDWTFGCIAVNNSDMEEIWKSAPDGTPIEINP